VVAHPEGGVQGRARLLLSAADTQKQKHRKRTKQRQQQPEAATGRCCWRLHLQGMHGMLNAAPLKRKGDKTKEVGELGQCAGGWGTWPAKPCHGSGHIHPYTPASSNHYCCCCRCCNTPPVTQSPTTRPRQMRRSPVTLLGAVRRRQTPASHKAPAPGPPQMMRSPVTLLGAVRRRLYSSRSLAASS
jgi:hypothetical protein